MSVTSKQTNNYNALTFHKPQTSSHANLLEQKKVYTLEKSSTPSGLVWDTNKAIVSLLWDTKMAVVMSSKAYFYCMSCKR